MARTPNYSFERREREKKRAAKRAERQQAKEAQSKERKTQEPDPDASGDEPRDPERESAVEPS